jgi:Ca-activated chloride channel family protein
MTEVQEHRRLLRLIQGRPAGARMFCIGIGNDVNRPLLRQIARSTGGLAAFLSRGDDFERQAKGFRRKLLRPAIADVQIQADGVAVYGVQPRNAPNLYHGAPFRMYARYRKGGRAKITLSGTIQGKAFAKVYEIDLPKSVADDNPEIERMWAWHSVQGLMDQERAEGETGKHVPKIVELCEGFSIPSEYASFLVLENDAEYKRWKIERRNASRLDRDRAAQARVRKKLESIRSRAERGLGPRQVAKGPKAKPTVQRPARRQAQPRTRTQPQRRTQPRSPSPEPTREPSRRRRSSGGRGGGAIDPVTGMLGLGLIFAAAAAGRRRRRIV